MDEPRRATARMPHPIRGPSPSRLASLAPQGDGARELPSRSAVMATSTATTSALSDQFIIPLTAATAVDAERVGPKAANLAALLHAGLPTPGGFCLSADAYRTQIAALGLDAHGPRFRRRSPGRAAASVGRDQARPLRAADRAGDSRTASRRMACAARHQPGSERGAFLRADRGSQGRQFRRPVRELSRHRRGSGVPDRRARVLGRAVDHECAPLHGEPRPFARGHGHGRARSSRWCRPARRAAV